MADAPIDVENCDSYMLPTLTNGNYFTGTGGTGTAMFAGDAITTSTTLYVFSPGAGSCPNVENSFDITINNTPLADAPIDVESCDSYLLPALTNGNYFTGTGGTGTPMFAGDVYGWFPILLPRSVVEEWICDEANKNKGIRLSLEPTNTTRGDIQIVTSENTIEDIRPLLVIETEKIEEASANKGLSSSKQKDWESMSYEEKMAPLYRYFGSK